MKFEIFYPVRPYRVNRKWGELIIDLATGESIYKPFGFTTHNGVDLALVNGQEIKAPCDCIVVRVGSKENGNWQPQGGGVFVGIVSKNVYEFLDGKQSQVLFDFLHCEKILVQEGQEVGVGDVIALGDNTGFSTGSHTHMQPRRVSYVNRVLTFIDQNEANGSFNPEYYWNGVFAEDGKKMVGKIAYLLQLLAKLLKGRNP